MFLNVSFYEVKASQHAHYSFVDCCVHVCTTIYLLEIFTYVECIEHLRVTCHQYCHAN
jgi:hypothetical protein